ncbi:2-dehydro-3-deoxygalactonokinase [Sulfitobacter sp. W002]|uniref:2-dehydro-3-deoxygalactonokinase n=1 Tax=unclassified Sulfitobacter TaxID=196795 RepID=UPI000ECF173A|nr:MULTISPECIES: 2-dehydro-3-deoxygalactonokinase [unclassified Sulfitobacter]UWR30909.1 2-dehydro-3-deoxygalactonokinase [Sulfitobacter sp. W002]UWR38388.1 2-dehydro-3-deoxygalactonokinase [Sulfitobacter sp. W074]HCQ58653.1 2-keto-3-deoxy-galactonokinase [Sulfitobacter sp.]|tara:strand:+ start:14517 stop:15449 length:933 start_codon:yes stop_codon:yes gene_type:complete
MYQTDLAATTWVAADWGSTNLRLWLMTAEDKVAQSIQGARGAAHLTADEFEAELRGLLAPVLVQRGGEPLEVIACGMVGSRQGWAEAAYQTVPAAPVNASQARTVSDTRNDLRVHILPGLQQLSPPDVMRGEETQIGGLLVSDPDFDGVVCLPGTHSKWARVAEGQVKAFSTCMTGELFALLSGHSVLRHTVDTRSFDMTAFESAASEALHAPEGLSRGLFSIRADALVTNACPGTGAARLSGLLIGAEIGSLRSLWPDLPMVVLGASSLSGLYVRVLHAAGMDVTQVNAEDATISSLARAYRTLKGQLS